MKLQVIVDNNTYIDQYFLGEPAVCFYLEDAGEKILFDTGYSDVAHPDCLLPKKDNGEMIGAPFNEAEIKELCSYQPSREPIKISEHITFLGEIPQSVSFEEREAIGKVKKENGWEKDLLFEDSALVCKTTQGLFIITGCSHSGICNIIEYAKAVCHEEKIYGVIGGFHLLEMDTKLEHTIEYLSKMQIEKFYPCHCVSFKVKAKLNEYINVQEVGVGLKVEID